MCAKRTGPGSRWFLFLFPWAPFIPSSAQQEIKLDKREKNNSNFFFNYYCCAFARNVWKTWFFFPCIVFKLPLCSYWQMNYLSLTDSQYTLLLKHFLCSTVHFRSFTVIAVPPTRAGLYIYRMLASGLTDRTQFAEPYRWYMLSFLCACSILSSWKMGSHDWWWLPSNCVHMSVCVCARSHSLCLHCGNYAHLFPPLPLFSHFCNTEHTLNRCVCSFVCVSKTVMDSECAYTQALS